MAAAKTDQIYTQWCEDFRALQTVFWQVPFFAMTITGGLGAAVIAFDGAIEVKRILLAFAGICNFSLIMIAWRIRKTMESLLIKIYNYEGVKKTKSGFFVLKCFTGLFAIVGLTLIGSAIFSPSAWLSSDTKKKDQNGHNSGPMIIFNYHAVKSAQIPRPGHKASHPKRENVRRAACPRTGLLKASERPQTDQQKVGAN